MLKKIFPIFLLFLVLNRANAQEVQCYFCHGNTEGTEDDVHKPNCSVWS